MSWVAVCLVALAASAMTLFSGFGLGTLLLPAFALVFPAELAVAATAVVHLANNVFKLALVGRKAQRSVVLAFGLPALAGAVVGAWLLGSLSGLPAVAAYELAGREATVSWMGLALGTLIAAFAVLELRGGASSSRVRRLGLRWGGLISGFFGGLSGHQGALRSAVLVASGLDKDRFIATGVWCSVLVDVSRLAVYGLAVLAPLLAAEAGAETLPLLGAATLSAFAGAWIGVRVLGRVTIEGLRKFVGVLLVAVGVALAAGWI